MMPNILFRKVDMGNIGLYGLGRIVLKKKEGERK